MAITLASICAIYPVAEFLSATELIVLHACGNRLVNNSLANGVRRYNEFYERDKYHYNLFMKRFPKTTILYSTMGEYLGYPRNIHTETLDPDSCRIDIPSTIEQIIAPNAIVFIKSCPNPNNIRAFCKYWVGIQCGMPLACRSISYVNANCTTDVYVLYNGGTFYIPVTINKYIRLRTIIVKSRCFEYNNMLSKLHTMQARFPGIEIETDLICKYKYCRLCSPRRVKRQQYIGRWEFYDKIKSVNKEITKLNIDTGYFISNMYTNQVCIASSDINLSVIPQHVTKLCLNTYDDRDTHIFDKIILKNINNGVELLHPYIEHLVLKGTAIDSACDLSRFKNLRTIIMKQYGDSDLKLVAKKLMAKYPYLAVTII